MLLKSDTWKTVVKFLAVAVGAYAGTQQSASPVMFAALSAFGVALQGLTVSGWTTADLQKTGLKLAGQLAATFAGSLQATQPQLASLLLAVGAALPAITVQAPGTAARIGAAKSDSVRPPAQA